MIPNCSGSLSTLGSRRHRANPSRIALRKTSVTAAACQVLIRTDGTFWQAGHEAVRVGNGWIGPDQLPLGQEVLIRGEVALPGPAQMPDWYLAFGCADGRLKVAAGIQLGVRLPRFDGQGCWLGQATFLMASFLGVASNSAGLR
jgi:hypothetical protein